MLKHFFLVILAASWLCGSIVRQSSAQEDESIKRPNYSNSFKTVQQATAQGLDSEVGVQEWRSDLQACNATGTFSPT